MANSKATILVVDDEENTRKLLQRILEEANYEVVTASTGCEAIDKVSSVDVSLVLLDIIMPEMDGFQTLELIREKTDIPVIMVTGMGQVSSLETSLSLGADDYVKKPFRSGELLARIKAKLRRVKH
ncbi:response regulator transcription factor [Chloroflexota bacterium]